MDESHSDGFFIKISLIAQKAFVSQPAWPYLPSKSALAPKLQLHSNINFIHNSMISGVTRPRCFQFSVNPESPGRKLWSKQRHNNNKHTVCFLLEVRGQERSDGVLQTVHLRYSGGEKAARCLEAEWLRWVCARARVWNGTHSAGKSAHSRPLPTHPPLSSFLPSQVQAAGSQPTAPTAVWPSLAAVSTEPWCAATQLRNLNEKEEAPRVAPLHAVENALMNLLRHAGVLLATQVDVDHAAKTKQWKLLRV